MTLRDFMNALIIIFTLRLVVGQEAVITSTEPCDSRAADECVLPFPAQTGGKSITPPCCLCNKDASSGLPRCMSILNLNTSCTLETSTNPTMGVVESTHLLRASCSPILGVNAQKPSCQTSETEEDCMEDVHCSWCRLSAASEGLLGGDGGLDEPSCLPTFTCEHGCLSPRIPMDACPPNSVCDIQSARCMCPDGFNTTGNRRVVWPTTTPEKRWDQACADDTASVVAVCGECGDDAVCFCGTKTATNLNTCVCRDATMKFVLNGECESRGYVYSARDECVDFVPPTTSERTVPTMMGTFPEVTTSTVSTVLATATSTSSADETTTMPVPAILSTQISVETSSLSSTSSSATLVPSVSTGVAATSGTTTARATVRTTTSLAVSSHVSSGVMIGIIVLAVLLFCILVALFITLRRRRRRWQAMQRKSRRQSRRQSLRASTISRPSQSDHRTLSSSYTDSSAPSFAVTSMPREAAFATSAASVPPAYDIVQMHKMMPRVGSEYDSVFSKLRTGSSSSGSLATHIYDDVNTPFGADTVTGSASAAVMRTTSSSAHRSRSAGAHSTSSGTSRSRTTRSAGAAGTRAASSNATLVKRASVRSEDVQEAR